MNEKVKVILRMNALLKLKLLNPRKPMNCWQPNPITSLESSSDSLLYDMRWNAKVGTCVSCLWWNEPKHLSLSETMNVRFWLMILPWFLSFLLAYFSCDSNAYVPIFEKPHVCEKQLIEAFQNIQFIWLNFSVKQTPFFLVTSVVCHLRTSELFFLCLRTSKTVNLGEFVSHLMRFTSV